MGNWPGRPTEADRNRLDAALNEILTWACDNLPYCWGIEIRMAGGIDGDGEAGMELIDPDGVEVSADWDCEQRNLWRMVGYANNPDDPDVFSREVDC